MDFSRLRTGEIVAGIGGLALLVFLFFDWFGGGAEVSGPGLTVIHPGISGWDALTDLPGFLIILAGVAGIKLAGLTAIGKRINWPLQRGVFTLWLGWLATALVLWRMVAGSPDLKIGIFLGLAAVVAVWVGAWLALQEDGYQPLLEVAAGRARTTAAAGAPPATPTKKASTPAKRTTARSGSGSKSSSGRTGSSASRKGASKKTTGKKASGKKASGKKK